MSDIQVKNEASAIHWDGVTPMEPGTETYTNDQMNLMVLEYWETEDAQRRFYIPFWRAIQLIESSPSNQLALRVCNPGIPELVYATFISYNEGAVSASEDCPNKIYFVLDH